MSNSIKTAPHTELAFIFPGQGSQAIGMLADLDQQYPQIASCFNRASDVLGYDLWELLQNGEQTAINMTEVTQPLLLTASIALWHIWRYSGGIDPIAMAGHSLGEWSALVASEVIEFEDAVRLVRNRGAYMQSACAPNEGAMYAIIGLEDRVVEQLCKVASTDEFVGPVNYNSPGQLVIAGHAKACKEAAEQCQKAGAKKVIPLPVSAPFHTPLMQAAADNLASEILATQFKPPQILIVHNAGICIEQNPDAIKRLMIEQITRPVHWVKCITQLCHIGATKFVECGPGKVLSGLNKRIDRSLTSFNLGTAANLQKTLSSLLNLTQSNSKNV